MAEAKVLSVNQIKKKKHDLIEGLPPEIIESFGFLPYGFTMLVHGKSGHGKTNLLMKLMIALAKPLNKSMYLGLEEGFGYSMSLLVNKYIDDELSGKIQFADHTMTYQNLWERLEKQRSADAVFTDSVQYWGITYEEYLRLKEKFPKKIFIYNSHSEGSKPKGTTAKAIEYDAAVKVYVEGYIAFIRSRFGGSKIYVIWEEGARKYYGDKEFEKITNKKTEKKKKGKKNETVKNEKDSNHDIGFNGGNTDSVQPGGNPVTDRPPTDGVEVSERTDHVDQE